MRIESSHDIPPALAKGYEEGGLLLKEDDLAPSFFDLRSGLAGELFQKFVNYGVPLALVVRDPSRYGERFSELALEHRNHPMVRIVESDTRALEWLMPHRPPPGRPE
jgi:hypothetical protein